jgi:hypothetical protein
VTDATDIIERYMFTDEDCEKINQYCIANQKTITIGSGPIPDKDRLGWLRFYFIGTQRNWRGLLLKESAGASLHTQSWVHLVTSKVPWGEMRYVTSIGTHVKTNDTSYGDFTTIKSVSFLTNGSDYFYVLTQVQSMDLVPGKWFLNPGITTGCLNNITTKLNGFWDQEWLDKLRSRNDPKLAPLITSLESTPYYQGPSTEQIRALRDALPKPTKNDILKALDIAAERNLEQVHIQDIAINSDMLQKIVAMSSLKLLILDGVQLSDADVPKLLHINQLNLDHLNLRNNLITTESVESLSKLRYLIVLDLGGNPISNSESAKVALKNAGVAKVVRFD